MLNALELAGFKSFADRTRFDFPDGITVIVGPNGSGKSNVVDAIKWVLGVQSAKALRGKDMIDVIFKGSSSSGRKASNSAEATLVFDNSQKQLSVDADEVNVTRRVYRSGESEYLINGQACRLKDIKDLFRGTGVGVDAYSLIEQGKVDRMLQASPKERRLIFEEAAGISKFNAKKAEANRRIQRVDQNLVRLKDIVDEVHTRLKALQNQASKAQRFREMTTRLRELRVRLGWTEYQALEAKSATLQARLAELEQAQVDQQSDLELAKQAALAAELNLHAVAEKCQTVEGGLQDTLQQIAVDQNQQESLRHRIEENLAEQSRHASRLATLRARAGSVQEEVDSIAREVDEAQAEFDLVRTQSETAASAAQALRHELDARKQRHDALRTEHVSLLREASQRSTEVAQKQNMLSELLQSLDATETSLNKNRESEANARKAADLAAQRLKQIHQQHDEAVSALANAKTELDESRVLLANQQEQAALLQGRIAGATERLEILEQLEQHLEGVDSGARHVLDLARQHATSSPYASIHGLVAELFDVEVSLAPLIDTALGPSANALVLSDGQIIQLIRNGELEVPGRLSMMRLDRLPTRRFGEKIQLDGVRGVIGRADRLVRSKPEHVPLITYLLGTTWLVESLDSALELGHFRGAGLRFVTAACELIDSDGTLTIGALQSSSGLVSRRSELKNTHIEIQDLKTQYQKAKGEIKRTSSRIEKLAPAVLDMESNSKELAQEFARYQASAQSAATKLDEIEVDAALLKTTHEQQAKRRAEIEPAILAMNDEVRELQARIVSAEKQLAEHDHHSQGDDERLARLIKEETATKISLARAEQRLESVQTALEQSARGREERLQAVHEADAELQRLRRKQQEHELDILRLTSRLADASLRNEAESLRLDELAVEAAELRQARTSTAKEHESVKRLIEKTNQQVETSQLELERYQESGQTLLKRFRDDYEIEFDELSQAEEIEEPEAQTEMDSEASQLRQDISSVGEINMAALAELDELQSRYDLLNGQYEDLMAAKESLQRIIQKINNDSRRMFLETLEVIRENFQKLYRKSFGGGNADIVLEEGEDVLECGIDIIATPPGKTALSNSLLSGGEKALTAVALLLAIFQYRPSPFCVLDEVDAPFDEANIGRFVSVLTEFLDWTKFIIVTHSKKTMTASTTLYGVTMQESGVSKQVAVRFEDVNDKGEIIKPKSVQRRAA